MLGKSKALLIVLAVMISFVFVLSGCGAIKAVTVNSTADLKGLTVGCQISTTADESLKKLSSSVKFTSKKYDKITETFSDLKAGRLDAVVVDEVVARDYVAKNPKDFKVTSVRLTNEPMGITCRKADTDMRDTFNKVLDELSAEDKLKAISNKWFGEDLTSNLDVPKELTDLNSMGTSTPASNPFEGKTKLVVGVDNTYPPMEYTNDKNEVVGFDVDMANAIASKLNLKLEFKSMSWDGIFIALQAKKFDCIISSCSINKDRLNGYSMTKPYIANAQVIVTRA